MASVRLFIDPAPGSEAPFKIISDALEFTRVPSVGEFVALGSDEDDQAADYEVVLVHHSPLKPNDIDAEVYIRRVSMPDEILPRRPEVSTDSKQWWKPGSRPKIARERKK